MPPQAPIVIRHGAVLIHVNDPKEVGPVLDSLSRSSMLLPPTDTTIVALIAHEAAVVEVRRATGSFHSSSHKDFGRDDLAKRLRTSARARGVAAHPDGVLAQDIRSASQQLGDLPTGAPATSTTTGDCDAEVPKLWNRLSEQRLSCQAEQTVTQSSRRPRSQAGANPSFSPMAAHYGAVPLHLRRPLSPTARRS